MHVQTHRCKPINIKTAFKGKKHTQEMLMISETETQTVVFPYF